MALLNSIAKKMPQNQLVYLNPIGPIGNILQRRLIFLGSAF